MGSHTSGHLHSPHKRHFVMDTLVMCAQFVRVHSSSKTVLSVATSHLGHAQESWDSPLSASERLRSLIGPEVMFSTYRVLYAPFGAGCLGAPPQGHSHVLDQNSTLDNPMWYMYKLIMLRLGPWGATRPLLGLFCVYVSCTVFAHTPWVGSM